MENIYTRLNQNALVETAEEFSTDWCWRSKSWFAVQKNSHADFSIPVAINCLNRVKMKLVFKYFQQSKVGSFVDDDIAVLHNVRDQLEAYLLQQHRIAVVTDAPEHDSKQTA
jgi:hypothetical protein